MDNLYSRLIDLLGKRYNDPIFPKFVADIGEQPEGCDWSNPILFNQPDRSFDFYKSGTFLLRFKYGVATDVIAAVNTSITRSGEVPSFKALPAGIVATDRRAAVESKLGQKPFSSSMEGRYDAYYFDPHVLTFNFDEDETLSIFEIEYRP